MVTAKFQQPECKPLAQELRTALATREAAHHLNRSPQTLRIWACRGEGPIQPIRVGGRLAWPVIAIRKLLGV
jgi:hypothetical protein